MEGYFNTVKDSVTTHDRARLNLISLVMKDKIHAKSDKDLGGM
jgi:hypothetical protein